MRVRMNNFHRVNVNSNSISMMWNKNRTRSSQKAWKQQNTIRMTIIVSSRQSPYWSDIEQTLIFASFPLSRSGYIPECIYTIYINSEVNWLAKPHIFCTALFSYTLTTMMLKILLLPSIKKINVCVDFHRERQLNFRTSILIYVCTLYTMARKIHHLCPCVRLVHRLITFYAVWWKYRRMQARSPYLLLNLLIFFMTFQHLTCEDRITL